MAWPVLVVAGVLEIGWAIGLKSTDGFTRAGPTVVTVAAMALSLTWLGLAVRTLPVGTAYAVWTGIGTVGTALLGIVLFGESAEPLRLDFIAKLVAGIVGLKLVTPWSRPTFRLRLAPAGTGPGFATLMLAGRRMRRQRRRRGCGNHATHDQRISTKLAVRAASQRDEVTAHDC